MRYTAKIKAEIVLAVRNGDLTEKEACEEHNISPAEFAGWARALDRAGTQGLRVTRTQTYRAAFG